MRLDVKPISDLSQFEKARIDCVVTSSLYACLNGTKWAEPDWAVMVWEDEDLVTNVHIVERKVKVGQASLRLGGIGNVATKVEWRKRGYAGTALQTAMEFLVDPLAVDFGLMITTPPLVARYERLGWIKSAEYLWAEQPQGRKRLEFPVMVLSVKEDRWPQGEVDLCGLPW